MGAFVWEVENESAEEVEVSIMFTFQNGTETKDDRQGGHWNEPFCVEKEGCCVRGVMLHHVTPANPYTLAISAREKVGPSETPQDLGTVRGQQLGPEPSMPFGALSCRRAGRLLGVAAVTHCGFFATSLLSGPRGGVGEFPTSGASGF